MFPLKELYLSGAMALPIIEGGKGIGVSNGITAGHFAKNGAIGTFSGVNAEFYDENGNYVPQVYDANLTRKEKFEQLIKYAIKGAIAQAKIAHDISAGKGRIHMNILWEAGGAKRVIESVLEKTKGLIHGITCGAGLPYELAELANKYKVYYYPIVSSSRAFSILWKRAYHKCSEFLGGVVYEDPWVAGGHVGLSIKDDPNKPDSMFDRVLSLRKFLTSVGLKETPIVIAGGIWRLKNISDIINNKELGNLAFQFGSRPLLTQESPIPEAWKQKLLTLKADDIVLNRFSPTGLPSIAVKNSFLKNLIHRSNRQISFSNTLEGDYSYKLFNRRKTSCVYIKETDVSIMQQWMQEGFDIFLKTPDSTIVFVDKQTAKTIKQHQTECMGCLSQCVFSNWSEKGDSNTTGKRTDPRSFCIQKTLQKVMHGGDIDKNLLFAGKNAYKFATDPMYKNNHIPTIKELIHAIRNGN